MLKRSSFLPKSLYWQILLVAALALFVAQALNAYMLITVARSKSDAAAATMLISRVASQSERLAERGRSWDDRQIAANRSRKSNIVINVSSNQIALPNFKINKDYTEQAQDILPAQTGLSEIAVARGPLNNLPRELSEPLMRGAAFQRMRILRKNMPTDGLLLTAKSTGGNWISAAVYVRPRNSSAIFALLLQTATLYIAVMIPLALVARRIVRPLERLKVRVGRVGLASEVAPLESEGPMDIRELIDSFNNMQARVSALLSEKDVMLGAIGHDLKTPLAALRVRIESVEDDAEREKMADSIDELVRILDDILTLARLGKSGEAMQKTDMSALIGSIIDEFEVSGSAVSFVPPDERMIADVRPLLIRRALRNLIGNAVKHGASAAISIERTGGNLHIYIDDQGPGIASGQIEEMFAPFARADVSRNRATGGTGLGLTIARAIARSHDGDVTLTNRREGGLRAALALPANMTGLFPKP